MFCVEEIMWIYGLVITTSYFSRHALTLKDRIRRTRRQITVMHYKMVIIQLRERNLTIMNKAMNGLR